jgi:hypothetical protein
LKRLIVPTAIMAKVTLAVVIFGFGTACADDGKKCSVDRECGDYEFCDTTPKCPGEGITGVCTSKPLYCNTEDYSPVTGCDGEVYSNACMAARNGKSIVNEEEREKRHHHREHRKMDE